MIIAIDCMANKRYVDTWPSDSHAFPKLFPQPHIQFVKNWGAE